jgi:alginate O-acetyltransferase complex protein AlgI
MWLLAAAIFAGCKWLTWRQARVAGQVSGNWKRTAAYLLLWPGMEPQEFFAEASEKSRIHPNEWLSGIAKTLAGMALIWAGARILNLHHPILGGWLGMIGLVLVLHFGTFHLIALAWQQAGIPVKAIMQRPLVSRSLSELWGRRWNLGFRKLSHTWVFQPLRKRYGVAAGTLGAFLASGLLHDLVISVPAHAGYGLPTAYFLAQGLGVLTERSVNGQSMAVVKGSCPGPVGAGSGFSSEMGGGIRRGLTERLWVALVALGPLCALFHPWFVVRVIDPFLRAIAG